MAGWTQDPNHIGPLGVFLRSPRAVAFISWLVRYFNNPTLATCLACFWGVGVPPIKSLNVVVGNTFGFSFFSMFYNHSGVPIFPRSNRSGVLPSSTLIRTKPFLALIGANRKNPPAISTLMLSNGVGSISPSVCSAAFFRTKCFWPSFAGRLYLFPAVFTSICFHVVNIQKGIYYVK